MQMMTRGAASEHTAGRQNDEREISKGKNFLQSKEAGGSKTVIL